ncbi:MULTISPECIES: photosystem II reaction center protein PsbM [unclassified Synechococcus]|jgi:photosystem II reaction center protein PsbM|uniref:Photosystem II reaction center protein M n=1 Tax=Synechococcus sp. (strain JA-3-3Ab) TaxID=321327 RepID=PSBM_SYNJA|nr:MULTISPECIES: photosystem II reaction center protein PsbM [unclassified Synechococcus]Q2JWK3.1 RecName: Full=Photosystem II reaction center protein M; Short=PSII-M [Synechococcus sp. JA-3-3Ab]ABC98856.1 photosystem II reaction center protein PsbM [Synechococcus sp. JA-3-3Ab]PIK85707.1 photosystem II reaction center protein M [Synechococcus sp. 63AY4M2]PIK88968.1 photosystem II reaction center protein M [Synechococcus sp. 65AY6A5]PIK91053.1 photosystem II reaction center protein M [Synechoco
METNYLGLLATILVILVPSIFLVILYVQTSSKSES